jgi:hypothetical protein
VLPHVIPHPKEDEPGLLGATKDLNRMFYGSFGNTQKLAAIVYFSEGVGSDDANMICGDATKSFCKPGQAVDGSFRGTVVELPIGMKPRCKRDPFAKSIKSVQPLVAMPGDNHVK